LKGNLHVVRKYDNPSNTLQSILFVESIEKQSKDEEIENTDMDIEGFQQFAKESRKDEKDTSLIDDLVPKGVHTPAFFGGIYLPC
jgi:hypothetical protein